MISNYSSRRAKYKRSITEENFISKLRFMSLNPRLLWPKYFFWLDSENVACSIFISLTIPSPTLPETFLIYCKCTASSTHHIKSKTDDATVHLIWKILTHLKTKIHFICKAERKWSCFYESIKLSSSSSFYRYYFCFGQRELFINQKLNNDFFSSESVIMPKLPSWSPSDAKTMILEVHGNGFIAFINILRNSLNPK